MYRFILNFPTYKITSSGFASFEECSNSFDYLHWKLNPLGGHIEVKVLGMGWVVHE